MHEPQTRPGSTEREFARIEVDFVASIRPFDIEDGAEDEAALEARRALFLETPSVWSPTDEAGLREMVVGESGSGTGRLAQAILDLSAQLVRLQLRMETDDGTRMRVRVVEISGGGGRLSAPMPLQPGDRLEIRFDTENEAIPPIRALIEVLHVGGDPANGEVRGFRFDAIHPSDQERLIRWIYQLQRAALRRGEEGDTR